MGAGLTPGYSYWVNQMEKETDSGYYGFLMICMIWILWFLVIVFNVVVLLNFLIAYISETYEEVYGRDKIDDFKNMAELNHDCRGLLKALLFIRKYFLKGLELLILNSTILLVLGPVWLIIFGPSSLYVWGLDKQAFRCDNLYK